jgi:hypothetical protein
MKITDFHPNIFERSFLMDTPDKDNLVVQFVWDGGFSPGYMQIGSFQVEGSNWPLIFVTVPVRWAEAHRDEWDDTTIKLAKIFVGKYNAGQISESDGNYKIRP